MCGVIQTLSLSLDGGVWVKADLQRQRIGEVPAELGSAKTLEEIPRM
jgi:hypothetical protein